MSIAEAPVRVDRDALAALSTRFRYPDDPQLQAIYTSTFDLDPTCSPYLGVHVFGDDDHGRARLMVGLKQAYARAGLPPPQELPDHIAEVLVFAPLFEEEEWRDLLELILKPALAKMAEILAPTSNPYKDVVAAAAALCCAGGEP